MRRVELQNFKQSVGGVIFELFNVSDNDHALFIRTECTSNPPNEVARRFHPSMNSSVEIDKLLAPAEIQVSTILAAQAG
jgi:hypothetical protein